MSPRARSTERLWVVLVEAKEESEVVGPEGWTLAAAIVTTSPDEAAFELADYDIDVGMPIFERADEYRLLVVPIRRERLIPQARTTLAALPRDVLLLPPETHPIDAATLMADARWQARLLTATECTLLVEQVHDCQACGITATRPPRRDH